MIQINRNPSRRELMVFGLIWLVFFSGLAGVLWLALASPRVTWILLALAAAIPALGWAWPAFLRWVYVGMAYLAWPIGVVVSYLLLGAVFYLLVTPIGLVMRLVGRDPMHRRPDPEARSYWRERDPVHRDPESYLRQY